MSNPVRTPKCSIVLTTLNGSRFIREAIDSCLSQSERSIELIIVDGGSTDSTLAILDSISDPRVTVIHQEGNAGKLPGAINLGLAHARGPYLTWMQDDCLYEPTAIARMIDVLDSMPNIGHVYCDYWIIDEDGTIEKLQETVDPSDILSAKSDPCGTCFMIRRETRDRVGIHNVDAYPTQDYDYRLRIALSVESHRIPEALFRWRIHMHSLSGSRPWTIDAYNDAKIRLSLGLSDKTTYRQDIGAIEAAWAFESYFAHRYREALGSIRRAIWQTPSLLLNRGVLAITVRSLLRLVLP